MKLEFIKNGSQFTPLIRIFNFDSDDIQVLIKTFKSLSEGTLQEVKLHELPGIEAIDHCQLTLKSGTKSWGVMKKGKPAIFVWVLTQTKWDNVFGLTEPFLNSSSSASFQWLDDSGDISVLLSQDGLW